MDKRWDDDERGSGVADARASLPAIEELAGLAGADSWVAEDPEAHLLPGLHDRIAISGLQLEESEVRSGGVLHIRLRSADKQSRREIRQSVWAIIGGAAELTSMVRETAQDGTITFEVVTGIPPGGRFATHGHTLRVEVVQPE